LRASKDEFIRFNFFRIDPVVDGARIAIVRSPSIEVCIQTAG